MYICYNHLNCEEIVKTFYEKELHKTNKKKFRIEKVIKKKGDKLYVKWKRYNNSFNSWIDKKWIGTGVDTLDFPKKTDLANWKSNIHKLKTYKLKNVPRQVVLSKLKSKTDELDIGKLEPTPVDLSKLSDVVKNKGATSDSV